MKLFYSVNSPFARKVRVLAIEKGLEAQITLQPVNPMENDPALVAANPIAKIPTLLLDDGTALCESPVICEYLDSLNDRPRLIPTAGAARWQDANLAALSSGMMDRAVSYVLETRRPLEKQWDGWFERQKQGVERTIAHIAQHALPPSGAPLTFGHISLGIALAYASFRLPDLTWRADFPALAAWFDAINARPSFQATLPQA